ncbi:hypothetical protein TREMEDRAFT_67928 [Tremella mesenterica DSM 1558]|uniref:uncharacterized protein n=1 Tax=Tremella mesenterica (strain ATCC 24925 / CBS 8224 / DSM 1558 / NBRC 9311 / NRRL Y-6157 / RJB 2259-6 / UBC 559-6) TaxID=578456 RepID=UPI0003F49B1B|nr:uncharacterized protein TREMEDRAFT_67928 [Tremella mesenterica DSM 1558]EIW71723.1 hypothetical protein TREMEDRAFT_67928 [Tremella mesenterica DSM 1558]
MRWKILMGNDLLLGYRINPLVLEGVPNFLPKANFDTITEWQRGLWTRLQAEVRNNPALLPVKQKWDKSPTGTPDIPYLLTHTARDPSLTLAYNYGALLLNNSYFLEGINPGEPMTIPQTYHPLEEKVVGFAEGIVGGGWLWLVQTKGNILSFDIIPTFSSGTLLVTNRRQQGRPPLSVYAPTGSLLDPTDTSEEIRESKEFEETDDPLAEPLRPSTGVMSRYGVSNDLSVSPLAVLNMFEHAYLGDKYGVWDRGRYARDWWRSIDWEKVDKRRGIA